MTWHVYLIKKGDLFLIGKARNLKKKMKKISPEKIIATLETDYPLAFEARLLRRYRNSRLPDSSYFNFNEKQLFSCEKQFGGKGNMPRTLDQEFYIALSASFLIFILSFLCLFKLGVILSITFSISLALASFPMLLLLFIGNFGGYNCSDLNIFYSWFNRVRALLMALIFLFLSYFLGIGSIA